MNKRIVAILATLHFAFCTPVFASHDDELSAVTNDLDAFAKTATATKQNIDYLPYIVSVWSAQEFSKLGVRTLKEALVLLPGVDMSIDNINSKTPIFRGSNPFAFGQSRLIVDGVTVNDRAFDSYNAYLEMPLDIIKRIEVVRGPGSLVDGTNGYAGSINVITYSEEGPCSLNKVYAFAGSYSAVGGGLTYGANVGAWRLHTDFYYYGDNAKVATNGKDGMSNNSLASNRALSQEGYAPTWLNTYSLGVSAKNGPFSVTGRIMSYESGSAFGSLYALPNEDGRQSQPSWYLEGRYDREIARALKLQLAAGYMQDGWESVSRTYPVGMKLIQSNGKSVTYPDGAWADLAMHNSVRYVSAALLYDRFDRHAIKLGAKYSDEKNTEVRTVTIDRNSGVGWQDYTSSAPFFDPNAKRTTLKLYANDTYNVSDEWAVSIGVNSDKADDFDRQLDFRTAVVWQSGREDILKFMVTSAYRAPAWQEIYRLNSNGRVGNRDLKPERVDAYEMQYVRKFSSKESLSVNLFKLYNSEQIDKINAQNKYQNSHSSDIHGIELELKKDLDDKTFFYLACSLARGRTDTEPYLPAAAELMMKASVLHKFDSGFSAALIAMYEGPKKRVDGDSRADTPKHATFDAALNYDAKEWGAQLSVKNITDAKVLYPSEQNTYDGDYPGEKRQLFFKLFKRF